MSVSFPDCFSDLLCDEDSGTILTEESPGCSSDIDSSSSPAFLPEDVLRLTELVRGEKDFVPGPRHQSVVSSSAREESVAWIIKVHGFYRFQPLTAYLSVNYLDRFLYSCCLPETDGWPMQLLSVACLSLAAKMEEPLVPSLLDLQVEGAKYIFEPRTICRMELLILTVLDWRLRPITPFCFIDFFAFKVDLTGTFISFLISHATEVILCDIIQEFTFLEYRPSSIAAAAMLCSANTIPSLSLKNPGDAESWCSGLIKEEIVRCYRLMEALVRKKGKSKAPKVLPQFRVATRAGMRYSDSSSSSCSSSSSSPYNKRRKLDMCLWVGHEEKGNSSSDYEHEEKE